VRRPLCAAGRLEAQRLLADLDRKAPALLLLEERLVTRTPAARALGDSAAAHATLSQLEQLNADSIYRARLEGSCAVPAARAR
jgi:hypothetical protein